MKLEHEYIIAHADKSVLKISGLEVKGLTQNSLNRYLVKNSTLSSVL